MRRKISHQLLFSFEPCHRLLACLRSLMLVAPAVLLFLSSCDLFKSPAPAGQETFIKMYGGPRNQQGADIKLTPNGEFVILGSSNSFGNSDSDIYLIKADAKGNELWSRLFGGDKDDFGNSLLIAKDGNYIVLGTTTNEVDSTNILLLKVDADGNLVWRREIGNRGSNEVATVIKEDIDGNGYIIAGSTSRLDYGKYPSAQDIPDTDVSDVIMVRVDLNGNEVLTRVQGFNGPDIANDVLPIKNSAGSDEYVMIGTTTQYPDYNGSNLRFFKTNKNLGSNLDLMFGGEKNELGKALCQTRDGGIALLGSTASFGNGGFDMYMIKLKLNQNDVSQVESHYYGGAGEDRGVAIQQLPDGSFILLGNTSSFGNGGSDIYLLKVGQNGQEIWSRNFGDEGNDTAGNIITTPDGGFAILGTVRFGNNDMIYLIKTNSSGLLFEPQD